jgi:hypothetical protein
MKDADIELLSKNLPDLFGIGSFNWDNEDDWIVVNIDSNSNTLSNDERTIFGDESDEDSISGVPSNPIDDRSITHEPLFQNRPWPGQDRNRGIPVPRTGGDFPGGPLIAGDVVPPPDSLAFYLPFHHFSRKIWGIYLIAEGVAELAKDIVSITSGYLTRQEALIAARAYLFHHEAYHSAMEAFGTRLEVSHRVPVYLGGLRTLYKGPQFEEALATAYGFNCVKTRILSGSKRAVAVAALVRYHQSCPTPYDQGYRFIGAKLFKPAENQFLEDALRLSVPSSRTIHESTWSAASYMTTPAVRRGGTFSYLINKNSPLYKRSKLNVRYFDRRKFLMRLREELGGREIGGGRHPKWESATGKKVPIPYGKDVDHGTVSAILKQFGIARRPEDFLAAR